VFLLAVFFRSFLMASKPSSVMGVCQVLLPILLAKASNTRLVLLRAFFSNDFLNHGNYLAYGLAATTLWVLGIPHGFALMHGVLVAVAACLYRALVSSISSVRSLLTLLALMIFCLKSSSAYGLAATTLWVLGIPHGFALMHGKTRRGALVFDIADLIKDSLKCV
jgi:hypothetical protein